MRATALPAEFGARFAAAFGADAWASYSAALEGQPASRGLRLHRHKLAQADPGTAWRERLFDRLGPSIPWAKDAYYLNPGDRLGNDPLHAAGLYYVQEPSAMAPAALLDAKPGERVLDLCAAPGGKATQIGAMLADDGCLVANEPDPARAAVLSENVERAGLANCIVTCLAPEELARTYAGYFDAVLVDAPCSGEGLFRRQPEAAAMWSEELVARCAARQLAILQSAVVMLRPGGRLVYSTCTLNPVENEQVVARLLARFPALRLKPARLPGAVPGLSIQAAAAWLRVRPDEQRTHADGSQTACGDADGTDPPTERCLRYFPDRVRAEGQFAALFVLDGSSEPLGPQARTALTRPATRTHHRARANGGLARNTGLQTLWSQFAVATLAGDWLENLLRRASIVPQGDILYAAPDAPLPDRGVLRRGLSLAAMPHKSLVPQHALALVPDASRRKLRLHYGDPRILDYLAGAEIPLTDAEQRTETLPDGAFCLVTIDGLSLGWGKRVDGRLKNHYPRGLRRPYEFAL